MGIRTIAAGIVCKGSYRLLRMLGRGGTSLPGKLALKIDPHYLKTLSAGVKTVVLTGTNGKTTSTHIVAQALENAGHLVEYMDRTDETHRCVRFCTSWSTRPEDLEKLLADIDLL